MKRIVLLLVTIISLSNWGFSQNVGISAAGAPTDNSAGLDVNFTNKGLLIPRVSLASTTDVTTITTPAISLLVYNINAGMVGGSIGYWFWNGAMWIKFRTGIGGTEWALNGNSGTSVGTNFLGTTDAQDFAIFTNNAERIRVQSGGNVGIGTVSPQRLLHVSQTSSGTPSMLALENPNTTDGNGMSLSFRGTTTGTEVASFKEFSSIQSVFDTHDAATRASSLVFFTSARGFIYERMRIGATGNIGIGNVAPSNALHVTAVADPLRLEGLQTGAGTDQILTVDATGVVRQQSAASLSSLNQWSQLGNAGTVDGTNFIGTTDNVPFNIKVNNQNAGRIDNTNSITAFGYQSLNNHTGSNNTAIGQQSMFSNTTGSNNTATGKSTLYGNTTGIGNTANGFAALFNNTTGSYNTTNGYYSLVSNTTGKDNTASGSSALNNSTTGNQNTGIGSMALYLNTTGNGNTANGKGSLLNNTTGSYNASYGYNAGITNTSGNNNTFIGYQANASSANLTNATAIGYAAVAGASNTMVLGGTGADQVSVGIGTTTPNSYLETAGSFATGIITTTTNITLDKTHYTVIVTGGSPVITLPSVGTYNNRRSYRIINQNNLPVNISTYIDFTGVSASTVPANSKIEIQSNGINWYRVD